MIDWNEIKNINKRPLYVHNPVKWSELKVDQNEWGRIYYSPQGHIFPSITTLLGHTQSAEGKLALENWRNRLGHEEADKETKRCATRGDSLHFLAEQYLKNQEVSFKGHPRESVAMFKRFRRRLHRINNIRAQEIPLYSYTLGVAGRVDLVADWEGVPSIIDFKTSTKEKLKNWITDYFIQGSAYSYMFEEMFNIRIPKVVILMAVENSIASQVFIGDRKDYRKPLLDKITQFRELTSCQF